jgi:hypothetical protein
MSIACNFSTPPPLKRIGMHLIHHFERFRFRLNFRLENITMTIHHIQMYKAYIYLSYHVFVLFF